MGSAPACAHPALSISVSPSWVSLLSHKHFHLGLGVTGQCPAVIPTAAVGSVLLAGFVILASASRPLHRLCTLRPVEAGLLEGAACWVLLAEAVRQGHGEAGQAQLR